jgi:hypothetical protein
MPPVLRNGACNLFKGRDKEHMRSNYFDLYVGVKIRPIIDLCGETNCYSLLNILGGLLWKDQ